MQDSSELMRFCPEYVATGVHLQMNNSDCLICNFSKHKDEIERLSKKQNQEISGSSDVNVLRQAYDERLEIGLEDASNYLQRDLKGDDNEDEDANQDGDEDDNNNDENNEEDQDLDTEEMGRLFTDAKNDYIKKVADIFKAKRSGLEFILDNTMGFIINPNSMYGSRLDLARMVISLSLQYIEPEQVYNIFCTSKDLEMSAVDVEGTNTDAADNFLESFLPFHSLKEGVINTLVSRIEHSSNKISDIVVLTDYTKSDSTAQQKLIQEALAKKEHPPRIHVVNFILGGHENKDVIKSSFQFYSAIADLSKGSFINFQK